MLKVGIIVQCLREEVQIVQKVWRQVKKMYQDYKIGSEEYKIQRVKGKKSKQVVGKVS